MIIQQWVCSNLWQLYYWIWKYGFELKIYKKKSWSTFQTLLRKNAVFNSKNLYPANLKFEENILRYWNIPNTEFISSSKNFTSYIFSNKGLSFVAKWRMRFNLNILSWINENQFRYSKYRKYNLITKLASNTGAEIKNLKFKWVTLCVYSQLIKSLWY